MRKGKKEGKEKGNNKDRGKMENEISSAQTGILYLSKYNLEG